MDIICADGLTKRFNDFCAVDKASFTVKSGEIFGFLGPNGAGKTTTINMLCTLMRPTEGDAKICSHSVLSKSSAVRKCIGLVFQESSLDDQLTARENLEMHGRLYGMKPEKYKNRIKEVMNVVELTGREDDIVKTFSGGMRRRLEIARGLMHSPKILFLDEPTIGLDPQTRKHIWEYIIELKEKHKTTIFLTTHYMEEAEELCDRVAIMDHGKIIAMDTPKKLKDSMGGDTIILKVEDVKAAKEVFPEAKSFDSRLILSVENASRGIRDVLEKAKKGKIEVEEVELHQPTLNDVFLSLTGREIREEKGEASSRFAQMHAKGRFR